MAEIDIAKKRKPVWPWIVGFLVAILIAWLITEAVTEEENLPELSEEQEPVLVPVDTVPEDVQEYFDFVRDTAAVMKPSHEYTAAGLEKLNAALRAIVSTYGFQTAGYDSLQSAISSKTDFIYKRPESRRSIDTLRSAFTAVVEVVDGINKYYPDISSAELYRIKDMLDEGRLKKNHKEVVWQFFMQAEVVLRELVEGRPRSQ